VIERCFVKVEGDPAAASGGVRRAVGGFLRYIQHRDQHPKSAPERATPDVAGLVKYVAYRDKASARAELFGPQGRIGTNERKEFVDFATRSIEGSRPQLFRTRAGDLMDRRRVVSRFLISPESTAGLDLEQLARAAVGRLETDMGISRLRWLAAIHRNTDHHHVHLVLAGMHLDAAGDYRRVDITKPRLAAMKMALALDIERQRGERVPFRQPKISAPAAKSTPSELPNREATQPVSIIAEDSVPITPRFGRQLRVHSTTHFGSVVALRAAARRYQRRMQRELEESYRQNQWEYAA
jgi:hypothetical protein